MVRNYPEHSNPAPTLALPRKQGRELKRPPPRAEKESDSQYCSLRCR